MKTTTDVYYSCYRNRSKGWYQYIVHILQSIFIQFPLQVGHRVLTESLYNVVNSL